HRHLWLRPRPRWLRLYRPTKAWTAQAISEVADPCCDLYFSIFLYFAIFVYSFPLRHTPRCYRSSAARLSSAPSRVTSSWKATSPRVRSARSPLRSIRSPRTVVPTRPAVKTHTHGQVSRRAAFTIWALTLLRKRCPRSRRVLEGKRTICRRLPQPPSMT